jgi:Mlc titration factor MtfA (ptsG expression regulator)
MFPWSKKRRRQEIVSEPFPGDWDEFLETDVRIFSLLPPREQARLRDDLRIFAAEKHWEGCNGLEIDDEIRVTIAAHACVLALGVEDGYYFDRVKTVLVYPKTFLHSHQQGPSGIVSEDLPLSGQAWYHGPVILSWEEVLWDGRHPQAGRNVVFHEFAHQLDALDGEMEGTPPLGGAGARKRWTRVVDDEFHRLVNRVRHGEATLLDQYGASSRAEFFAVATECFFTRPRQLQDRHQELYAILRDFYHQDPAAWLAVEDRRS